MGCTIDSLSDEQIRELREYEDWLDSLEEFMSDEDSEMIECTGPMPYQS